MGLKRNWRHRRRRLAIASRGLYVRYRPGLIQHVRGPRTAVTDPAACTVVTPVHNGASYLDAFIEHYRTLGVARIVLLDNASSDATPERVPQGPDITLLQTRLPFFGYQQALRRALVRRWAGSGWALVVDIDEFFDYPGRAALTLRSLLAYLDGAGYTAMAAVMLDLYAPGPAHAWPVGGADMLARCRYYDPPRAAATDRLIRRGNTAVEPLHRHWSGGVRERVFRVAPWLNKYPLLRPSRGARPASDSPHYCERARVADVSGVLRHYKFIAGFAEQCRHLAFRGCQADHAAEYRRYLTIMEISPALDLIGATSRLDPGTDALLETGILYASVRYRSRAGLPGR